MNRMLHEVELNSLDVSNLMWDIQNTCVTNEDIEYLWEIKQVWLVRNKELTDRYERKRKLMKSLGRTDEETKDDLLFMAEGFNNVQRICEIGPRCKEKKNNVLGDTQYGIHMNRHYDILTRFMVFKNFQQANYLVILRGMLGRVKKVKPFFTGEYGCIAPTPNYDCHLAENAPDLTSIDISDAIAYNFAYMYEYDEETIIPMNYPSHVLPIAVLRLHRTRNRLDRTVLLNYTRERDLALSKKIQRLKNETKPMKHLPRSAPHKKYVVEGRRSGTRLISDVPIEPPSEKPPEETTKKLEKFRRPSALSGGTGMGYMFFRRPFNKMPTTWQRMFGFHSKRRPKSSHSPKKRVRGRSRSRSQSREPEKRKRSRTRSPKSPSSKSREKNLFELFDNSEQNQTSDSSSEDEKSNNGVTKQTTKCVVVDKKPSVSSIDTGCKKTVDQRSTAGNHTPTQDERHCNDVNISVSSIKEHGRNTGSGPNVRHDSQLSRMCLDQKRQTTDDHGSTRSREFSKSVSPERKPSDHGSSHVDTVKIASSESRKRSASSKDKENDPTYQLVRITLDEPDTPSIYHELRGIRIPSDEKKTVKDPRILRAMGRVIETPVMAGFGPFLRRIKEEPPEDESYGEKLEKRTKNILPVEFIKMEPENEQTEDDVEKALNELNNAIKAIQNNSSEDTDAVKIKKEPWEKENCTYGKTRAEAHSGKQTDKEINSEQENNTDDFLPSCGSKPVEKHQVEFSYEQLKQSHGVIGLQSGTNKYATQKGMRIGAVRHIADIRADDLSQDGQNHIGLQAGSNQFASQKGMTGFGAVRHISDIRADQYDKESAAHISLQSGTNKFDSQKGMRGGFGAVRHISDIRADQYSEESKSHISLQSGTNQFASQKGMTGFGAVRHIADIRADDLDREAAAEVSLQYGTNRFDSQKGMTSFGAQRHVSDIKVNDLAEDMRRKMGYTPSVQDMQEYQEQEQ